MRLIGLNGFKRSGKNTVGEIIDQAERAQSVKLVGFADKLKIAAARALGYESPELTELVDLMDTFKEHGSLAVKFDGDIDLEVSGREFLQRFGTEAGRETFWDSFWIDLVLPENQQDLHVQYDGYDVVVVTDVRFPNEAERIKQLGGEVWEIIRPGLSAGIHASEHPLPRDLVDVTIVNNGTILDLQDEVDRVLFP